jgi:TetR/AcrR family tetracycline transcriptional repressor
VSPKQAATAVREDLSRRTVVDQALAVADREGLDAVTIRRLAADLGVTPMALYWHVRNKEELLDAMGEALFTGLAEQVSGVGTKRSWPAQLRAVLQLLIDALQTHPGAVELAGGRILACEDGRVLTERALAILRSAGLSVTQSADAARQALLIAVTLVNSQAAMSASTDAVAHDAEQAAKRAALTALPVDRFPHLVEAADELVDCADEAAYYRSGIDLFVAGVESLAKQRSG